MSRAVLPLAMLLAVGAGSARAESHEAAAPPSRETTAAPRVLSVAAREVPPFAMRDAAGNWEGLSVDLWQDVAGELGVAFEWRELDLADTLAALERGEVDVAVAALTVTEERERRMDFAYPYLSGGLTLAVNASGSSAWLQTLRGFLSLEFLSAVAGLALILFVAAFAVWLFERRANAEQFGGGAARGLASSFWWSAVTMTTVGYGDKAPATLGGRIVAMIWMFTSVIVIAGFTASIAASVTVNRLESDLLDPKRLSRIRLATVGDSRATGYARAHGLRARAYASLDAAADALAAGEVDALLHDEPILRHLARTRIEEQLDVLEGVLVRDDYAFALPVGSPLRKRLNVALLSILHEPVWQNIRRRYLGAVDEDR